MLSAERVRNALSATRFTEVTVVGEVDSTNRVVRERADEGAAEGLVVIAEHQSAGRGRLGRVWEAPTGSAILMSILLRPELGVADWHLATAAVALAARSSCSAVAGFSPDLKWPNDLLVGDAKLAGILAEASRDAVVVGIGLNVSACPAGAAATDAIAGRAVDRASLVVGLLADLDVRVRNWSQVIGDYRAACATIGRHVLVTTHDGELRGRAEAVDDHGRLVVITTTGARMVLAAGDVTHLRPGAPPRPE